MTEIPTRDQARLWRKAYSLDSDDHTLSTLVKDINGYARAIPDTIRSLPWSGKAHDVAVSAGERQGTEMGRVGSALDSLRTTLKSTGEAMGSLAWSATSRADRLEDDMYEVDPTTWHVTDGMNYPLMYAVADAYAHSEADASARESQIDALRKQRAETAANESIALHGIATSLGQADAHGAAALTAALSALTKMTPAGAGVYPGSGTADAQAIENGTATPAQLERVRSMTGLSKAQLEALGRGENIDLPPEQSKYIADYLAVIKGTSVADLATFGDRLPAALRDPAKTTLVDAMQIGSNPSIKGDSMTGGIGMLPTSMQTLLRANPKSNTSPVVIPGTRDRTPSMIYDFGMLNGPNGLLSHGTPGLQVGSDLDRGIFKQASELASTYPRGDYDHTISSMLCYADPDRIAAHSFYSGQGMAGLVTNGGHYNAQDHVGALLTHHWAPHTSSGFSGMLEGIGNNAHSPNMFARTMAGEDARAVTQFAIDHHSELDDLGHRDPGVNTSLAKALSPYIASMVGAPDDLTGVSGFTPLNSGGDMAKLTSVVDSGHYDANLPGGGPELEGARIFNRSGFAQIAQLNQLYGYDLVHGGHGTELSTFVGRINYGLTHGLQEQVANQFSDAAEQRESMERTYGALTSAIGASASVLPGGELLSGAIGAVGPMTTDDVLGGAPTMEQFANPELSSEVAASGNQSLRYYQVLKGLIAAGRVTPETPMMENYFDQHGHLKSFAEIGGQYPQKDLPIFAADAALNFPGTVDNFWKGGQDPNWKPQG